MGRTELPWLFAGRLVRPYALAVSLASASLGILIVSGESRYGSGAWSHTVGLFAFICTTLLWVGWWRHSHVLMQHGLILTAAVFAARATFMALTGSPAAAAFMASWAVGSAGAWLLEQTTGHPDRLVAWYRNGAGGGESE